MLASGGYKPSIVRSSPQDCVRAHHPSLPMQNIEQSHGMKSNKLHRFVVLLLFSCILISFGAVRLYAQGSPAAHKLTVRAEKATAIYQKGETVSFHVRLLADGKPLAGQSLTYLVQGDGRYEKKGTVTSMDAVAVIEASLDRPGLVGTKHRVVKFRHSVGPVLIHRRSERSRPNRRILTPSGTPRKKNWTKCR